jgi:hypothetical protein
MLKKTLYDIFTGKIAKQVVGTSSGLWRMMDWTLWRGQPFWSGKEAAHRVWSRDVGAQATSRVMAPLGGGGEERKNFGWQRYTWNYLHLNSEPLGRSTLKEGAVGTVGEWSPRERLNHKKTPRAGTFGKKKIRWYACRLLGTNSLKEGAMLYVHPLLCNGLVNKFAQRQILSKQSIASLHNNRGGCVFYVICDTPSVGNGPMNCSLTRDMCFLWCPCWRIIRGSRVIEDEKTSQWCEVLVSVLRSVVRRRLVKTGNPGGCATVDWKVCKSATALY